MADGRRDLDTLPKAHLHLHFTGSLDVPTLIRLAREQGVPTADFLIDDDPLSVPLTERGWWRFQRSYDIARHAVVSEQAMRAVVRAAAHNDAAQGSRRTEIQVDPTSYAPHVDGIIHALEIVLDEAAIASREENIQLGVIVAASRTRHPMDARTLARLAARHAGKAPGGVIGFGLSNDESSGDTAAFGPAFRIARRAGLPGVPHGGETRGAHHIRRVIDFLHPTRLGHGVHAADDPVLLERIVTEGIALEINPASNVCLGVYPNTADVPLRTLVDAGAQIALGADDPLLFLSGLNDQYRIARDVHGFSDAELAELARSSIRASFASDADKHRWIAEVDAWLAAEPGSGPQPQRALP
ncbi:adenosine deaminase [Propionibacterium sp.]|uniref:adenosine deaminase n=1 Tax=Propionibacterium sp. TaxID=1977903 RepID=UPI0039EB8078